MQDVKVGATLQSVTGAGNTTDNEIIIKANQELKFNSTDDAGFAYFQNNSASVGQLQLVNSAGSVFTSNGSGQIAFPSGVVTSAQAAVNSTTKGFCCPRMTNAQMNAILSPAEGLQVYDTTNHVLCFYNGTVWKVIATV